MSDLISRESAIVRATKVCLDDKTAHDVKEALKALPSEELPSREYIEQIRWERDVAISQLKELGYGLGEKIRKLPSAQPERKTGRWIGHKADDPDWQRDDGTPVFLECSACQAFVINNGAANWNYCPNCGSYNGGEQDEISGFRRLQI